jgi:hypothetical protein
MRSKIDLARIYRRALLGLQGRMLDAGPPSVPLPQQCPWSPDELLGQGKAALRDAQPGDGGQVHE